jgi:hypothetical protein
MAYLAAMLEQHHIVRIYDLALYANDRYLEVLAALQRFGPDLLLLPLNDGLSLADQGVLACRQGVVAPLALLYRQELSELALAMLDMQRCDLLIAEGYERSLDEMLRVLGGGSFRRELPGVTWGNEPRRRWPQVPTADLDRLPFPARHLLELERYDLRAVDEQLQTTVLIGSCDPTLEAGLRLRDPAQVALELRSVARELGIRHFLLPHIPVTQDLRWLRAFCEELRDAEPKIFWEGLVVADQLNESLIDAMRQAGCEAAWFQFDMLAMLDSRAARRDFIARVNAAKAAGIRTRTLLDLQPPYDRLPALIDMTATFGIEEVQFQAPQTPPQQAALAPLGLGGSQIEQDAQRLYEETISRQRMIDRFGIHLGPMLWRLGIGGAS